MSEEKVKKPFYKRWWFFVIIGVVVIGMVGNAGDDVADDEEDGDDDNDNEEEVAEADAEATEEEDIDEESDEEATEEEEPEEDADDEEGNEEEADEEEEQTYEIGDEVEVGDAQFTVHSMETQNEVGPSVLSDEASGIFIVLEVSFENLADDSQMVSTGDFQIVDGDTTYEADSTVSITANQDEDGSVGDTFLLEDVNPGSEVTANVVFDVAEDVAESGSLQLYLEDGLFSSESALIDLSE